MFKLLPSAAAAAAAVLLRLGPCNLPMLVLLLLAAKLLLLLVVLLLLVTPKYACTAPSHVSNHPFPAGPAGNDDEVADWLPTAV
jgi:hypothetical protein